MGLVRQCKYCNELHCSDHRLPDNHACSGDFRKINDSNSNSENNPIGKKELLQAKLDEIMDKINTGGNFYKHYMARAGLLTDMNRCGLAIKTYDNILEDWPDNGEVLFLRGIQQLKLKKRREALDSFRLASQSNPENSYYIEQYNELVNQTKNGFDDVWERDFFSYNKLLKAMDLNNVARTYIYESKFEEALELMNKSLKIVEIRNDQIGISIILNNIAGLHGIRGEYLIAIEKYEQSIEIATRLKDKEGLRIIEHNLQVLHQVTNGFAAYLEERKSVDEFKNYLKIRWKAIHDKLLLEKMKNAPIQVQRFIEIYKNHIKADIDRFFTNDEKESILEE